MSEAVLILIKPDGIAKDLTGHLLTRLAETRLKMIGVRLVAVSRELANAHYHHLKDKPFFEEIIRYLTGEFHQKNPVLALVYYGKHAVKKCRQLAGATNPEEADLDSIRGSCGRITTQGVFENVLHVSSDHREAEREIKLWFSPHEILVKLYPTQVILKNKKRQVWA